MLASDEWAKERPHAARAKIIATAEVADDFAYLARTPAKASKLALEKAGLSADDIDLWEINEAFASVAINSVRMLGIDDERVNVNGGAIALGHPIGASGARILTTLVYELRRRGGGLGVAAICSGGGQGDAVIIEVNGNGPEAAGRRFPYTVLDVFTRLRSQGNALAVVHDADGLDDETMLRFARETRLSETTFVQAPAPPAPTIATAS